MLNEKEQNAQNQKLCLTRCDYERIANDLKPRGKAWPRSGDSTQYKFFAAIGAFFWHIEDDICCLLNEVTACRSDKLLCRWEADLGIGCEPECDGLPVFERPETLEQRRVLVCALSQPDKPKNCEFFEELALSLGWSIKCKVENKSLPRSVAGCAMAGCATLGVRVKTRKACFAQAGTAVPHRSKPNVDFVFDQTICPDEVEPVDPVEIQVPECRPIRQGGYCAGLRTAAVAGRSVEVFETLECLPSNKITFCVNLCESYSCVGEDGCPDHEPKCKSNNLGCNTIAGCTTPMKRDNKPTSFICPELKDSLPPLPSRVAGCATAYKRSNPDDLTWRSLASWQQLIQLFELFRPAHIDFCFEEV